MPKVNVWMLVAGLLAGCAMPLPSVRYDTPGKGFCSDLARQSEKDSIAYLTTGILTTIVAGALVATGAVVGPDTDPNGNWAQRNRNFLIAGAGALPALPSALLLTASKAASEASGAAAVPLQAQILDADAEQTCLEIRKTRILARAEVSALALAKVTDLNAQITKLQGELNAITETMTDNTKAITAMKAVVRAPGPAASEADKQTQARVQANERLELRRKTVEAQLRSAASRTAPWLPQAQ